MPTPNGRGFTTAELRMWELGRDFGARLTNMSTLDIYEAGLVDGYELAGRVLVQMLDYVTQDRWEDTTAPHVQEKHRELFIAAVRELTGVGRPWPCQHNTEAPNGYTDRATAGGPPSEGVAAGVARGDRGSGPEDLTLY